MPLVTGTGLQNQSDLIDTIRSSLATQGWSVVVNDGTVGANDKEVWLHLPAANTLNGYDILVGMLSVPSSPTEELGGRMRLSLSYLNPTDALLNVSPRNSFFRVLGSVNRLYTLSTAITNRPTGNTGDTYPAAFGGTVLGANVDADPVTINRFATGSNYLNHWIFTPNNSPLGSSQQYVHVVVEVETGVFRSFGFGELIKLGGAAWDGGLYVHGSHSSPNGSASAQTYYGAADEQYNGFTNDGEAGYALNFNNFNVEFNSPRQWNPWMFFGDPWSNDEVCVVGYGPRALGRDMLTRSPSAFSGQAIRLPARLYAMDNPVTVTEGTVGSPTNRRNNLRPLAEIPDLFHTNISDFSDAQIVNDDTESFIVFPYHRRTGTRNSGEFGFMIRHPDL